MNMKKISLSLLIIAGLMNSICCTAEEHIVTEKELKEIGTAWMIKNKIMILPEYLAVEQADEKVNVCQRNIIEIYSSCNAQGNCLGSVVLREALDRCKEAADDLRIALGEWQLKTGKSIDEVGFLVANKSSYK